MQKSSRFQKFWKLAQQMKIRLKNNYKESETLFKNFQDRPKQSLLAKTIQQACVDPNQAGLLKKLLDQISTNPKLLDDFGEHAQRRWNLIQKILDQKNSSKNGGKDNIFEKFYKQNALSEHSQKEPSTMLVIATPFKLKKVSITYKSQKVYNKVAMIMSSHAINNVEYSYGLIIKSIQFSNKLLLQFQEKNELRTIEVQTIQRYIRKCEKARLIVLDFTSEDVEIVRTTSILYCIGGLSSIFYRSEAEKSNTYQWLSLLYQQCFKVTSHAFKLVTNFELQLPPQYARPIKSSEGITEKAKYSISRLYSYLIMALLGNKQQIMTLYVKKQNILVKSLWFPVLGEHEYLQNKHLPQFQKIFLKLCWRFSLDVDKTEQYRKRMSKVAIFSQDDSQSKEIIKMLMENYPSVLASFHEDDLLKAITRNKYIGVGTILLIFGKVLKTMKQQKKKFQFQRLLMKFFEAILIKLEASNQRSNQVDRRQVWQEEITKQICQSILFCSKTSIFMVKDNWPIFYITLKKISTYHAEIYKKIMLVIEEQLKSQYKNYPATIKSIEAFSREPFTSLDQELIKNGSSARHLDLNQVQKVLFYRYQNPKAFNCAIFDRYFCDFLQKALIFLRDLKKIGESLKLLDKLEQQYRNQPQINIILKRILDIVDFSTGQHSAVDVSNFIKKLISLKTRLKDICYEKVKGKLLSSKIQKLEQILTQLQQLCQMEDKDRQYIGYIKKSLKTGENRDQKKQREQFWSALVDSRCASKLQKFKFNKQNLVLLVQYAKNKIQSNNFYETHLNHLHPNIKTIKIKLGQLGNQLCDSIQASYKLYGSFKQKLRNARQLLQQFEASAVQLQAISLIEKNCSELKLNLLYVMEQTSSQIKQFIQIAPTFKKLIVSSQFWKRSQKIVNAKDFLQHYTDVIRKMSIELNQFCNDKGYSYAQYQRLIKNEPIQQWCKLIFQDSQECAQICSKIQLLKINKLELVYETIQSIQFIENERDRNSQKRPSFTKFKELYLERTKNQHLQVTLLLVQLNQVLKLFLDLFSVHSSKQIFEDYKIKVVCLVRTKDKMLKQLKNMNITDEIILNLKQYINGDIFSNIKSQEVTSLQQANKFIKDTFDITFSDLIQYLKQYENKSNKLKSLAQSIKVCAEMFEIIKQKLKQAEDRETSFKDEIQRIFNDESATFNIELDSNVPHKLTYFIKLQQTRNIQKKDQVLIPKTLQIKQLRSLSENCLMFKSESIKNNENNTFADLLLKFIDFQKVISVLKKNCEKLLEYGYNPRKLKYQLAINYVQNSKFSLLKEYKEKVAKILKFWKQAIMKSYKQAYFLTFFQGYAIQELIASILTKKMPQRLAFQFQITQEEFLSIYGNQILEQQEQLARRPEARQQHNITQQIIQAKRSILLPRLHQSIDQGGQYHLSYSSSSSSSYSGPSLSSSNYQQTEVSQ